MTKQRSRRILIVTRNLPPLVGGMERLNWHMAEELAKVAEVRVIGPLGSAAMAPSGIALREAPLSPLWRFLLGALRLGRREAASWKPDIVLAGSGLTAPLAWLTARACRADAAVYAHGLDIAVKHPLYRALWLPAVRRMQVVIANSHSTAALCKQSGVAAERIAIVHPGVELPPTLCDGSDPGADFRMQYGLGKRLLLLSVGRLSTRKGLREFVAQALPQIVAAHPDVMLLVVGDAPSQALHSQAQTPESIQTVADSLGLGGHLRFLGKVQDELLGAAYRAADVHVFPVRELPGDPEGFGMVAVEAAAHGLPTVAFASGGVVDSVANGQSGRLVVGGDYPGLAEAVNQILARRDDLRNSCMDFAQQFAWPAFGVGVWNALLEKTGQVCAHHVIHQGRFE